MTKDEVRAAIARIPPGTVRVYSEITPEACALVGRVQNEESEGWHRVVYKNGRVKNGIQRDMLAEEGVEFDRPWKVKLPG